MKKKDYIILIIIIIIMAILVLDNCIAIPCIFHSITGFYCPGCRGWASGAFADRLGTESGENFSCGGKSIRTVSCGL